MATEAVTIRVARETRDLLAQQARERGVSLSTMLDELARDYVRAESFRLEREATEADARVPAVRDEERDWEAALSDASD